MSLVRFYSGRSKTLGHLPAGPNSTTGNSSNENLKTEKDCNELEATENSAVVCPRCGKADLWQAKQSIATSSAVPASPTPGGQSWLCWHCEPPPIKSLVAKRRGPIAEALVVKLAEESLESSRTILSDPARRQRPVIIAMEAPICPQCSGAWIIESDAGEQMKYHCWTCRAEIGEETFWECLSEPGKFRKFRKENRGFRNAPKVESAAIANST